MYTTELTRSTKDLFNALQQYRERQNLSIDTVSKALHLKPDTIRALEEGRVDELPTGPFVPGYIRLYCDYLGVDCADKLISEYRLLFPIDRIKHSSVGSDSANLWRSALGELLFMLAFNAQRRRAWVSTATIAAVSALVLVSSVTIALRLLPSEPPAVDPPREYASSRAIKIQE